MAEPGQPKGPPTPLEELTLDADSALIRPGTYFNPQTEVLVIVDDSQSIDQEIFNLEAYEGADWVLISEDVPVDEERRDELLLDFQTHYHPGGAASVSATAHDLEDDGDLDGEDEDQDPGRED
jgi:hypothetical protein